MMGLKDVRYGISGCRQQLVFDSQEMDDLSTSLVSWGSKSLFSSYDFFFNLFILHVVKSKNLYFINIYFKVCIFW